MLQSEPGDGGNLSPPSEENCDAPSEQTPQLKRVGLPWQFWVWQCVPMVCLFLWMPPGNTRDWWFHEPALEWILKQPWASLLVRLIFMTWFSQATLLAFWLVWGSGNWPYRFCKVMGLAAITTLLPEIWFGRHFRIISPGLTPWSEVLNPFELSMFFLRAVGVSFLPAYFATGTLYLMRYRLQQVASPVSLLGQWQFSLKGLSILTLSFSLVLSFFGWLYPASVAFISDLDAGSSRTVDESLYFYVFVLGSALAALLSAVILYWRNWRVTFAIFGLLLGTFIVSTFALVIFSASIGKDPYLNLLNMAGGLSLGNLVSLAISRYWIGWHRFRLIRLSKQISPQEA